MKLLVAGDFYMTADALRENASEDFVATRLRSFIKEHDYSVINFEGAVAGSAKPVLKTGPNLGMPVDAVSAVKNMGFNVATLANNHLMDFGRPGLVETLGEMDQQGIVRVGAGLMETAAKLPKVIDAGGVRCGLINLCQSEWGLAGGSKGGVNGIDWLHTTRLIKRLKRDCAAVVVITHMGHEYARVPSPGIRNNWLLLGELGADLVVNHHPHVAGGVIEEGEFSVFSSLGNFLFSEHFDSDNEAVREGMLASIEVTSDGVRDVQPIGIGFNPGIRQVELLSGQQEKQWMDWLVASSSDLGAEDVVAEKFVELVAARRWQYLNHIEPINSKFLRALRQLGLFNGLWSESKKRLLLNVIRCEAHREMLIKILEDEARHPRQ
ncbi:CapA family protein [Spiribacter sp. 221]|uniref:CapA family protein n=1 Tax=Spiribacter onubensis TaxID=3122420 RepID=UPI00349F3C28